MVLNLSTEIWPIPAVLKFFRNTPLKEAYLFQKSESTLVALHFRLFLFRLGQKSADDAC